jgi:hypothetical protein
MPFPPAPAVELEPAVALPPPLPPPPVPLLVPATLLVPAKVAGGLPAEPLLCGSDESSLQALTTQGRVRSARQNRARTMDFMGVLFP